MARTRLHPTLFWLGMLCIVLGLALILVGFFLNDQSSSHHSPFLSYLTTSLGGLFVFGASYTLLSEGFLRRNFSQEMHEAIDSKLRSAQNSQTISEAGLSEVVSVFSHHALHERVKRAQSVKMVVVKNSIYFREYRESLRERISGGQLDLEVLVPSVTDESLMELVARRYEEFTDGAQLAKSIADGVDVWLKEKIYAELPQNSRERLRIYLSTLSPLYSAYQFDRDEIWYIPYHCRMGRLGIPVYVYRSISEQLPIYRDLHYMFQSAQAWNLDERLGATL